MNVVRKVKGLWDVFARVGGIINIIKLFAYFIFTRYAEILFTLTAIDSLLNVQTENEDEVKTNFLKHVSLMTPCCANKKL